MALTEQEMTAFFPFGLSAQVLALIAAANARIEGMKAKNAIRESEGYVLAYDDEAFFIEAGFLEQLTHTLHLLS